MRLSLVISIVVAIPFCGAAAFLVFGLADLTTARVLGVFMAALEDRFVSDVSLTEHEQLTGIIALGGDIARTHEAIEIARPFPAAKLVVTGGSRQKTILRGRRLSLGGAL